MTDHSSPNGVEVVERFNPSDVEQMRLVREVVLAGQNATDDEFAVFLRVAAHSGLDPFKRQIYGIRRSGKLTIQTGIDGYRAIAGRTGQHAGTDDAVFSGRSKDKQYPGDATVTVYKLVGGLRVPFTATARWDEYKPSQSDAMWKKMPYNMLGKCAEALALRKAFPEETSGIDVEDTMANADPSAVTIAPPEREPTREELLAQRYADLPVSGKVQYTAWVKTLDISPPGARTDEELDVLEATLDKLAADVAETDAENPMPLFGPPCDVDAVLDVTEHATDE